MKAKWSMEKLFSAVKFVRNKQKDHFEKIEKLEKKIESLLNFEERLKKIEKAMEKELNETDRRFDTVSDRFDQIGGVIDEHIESITDLAESKTLIFINVRIVN